VFARISGILRRGRSLTQLQQGSIPKTTLEGVMMEFLETLNWRYATKKMDPNRIVPTEKVDRILEAVRLTPTSSGLQPFEIVVITDAGLRAKIRAIAHGQPQVTDCSHLLVFAAWDNYTAERINMMFDLAVQERGFTNDGWENYRRMLLDRYPPRSAEENFQHAAKQAYIALGFALIAAAVEEVDNTPMEGFDPDALDAILDLRARGLRSVLMLPLGYRDADNDWLVNLKKIRRPRDRFVITLP
jgi:nitroreductase/dihydropteridine reductase